MKKMLVLSLAVVMVLGLSVMAGATNFEETSIGVNVTVAEYAEWTWTGLDETGSVDLTLDPDPDVTSSGLSGTWTLSNNTGVLTYITTAGFTDANDVAVNQLNDYVVYTLNSSDWVAPVEFSPGSFTNQVLGDGTAYPPGSGQGTWEVSFTEGVFEDSNWYDIQAGEYHDVVTFTLSTPPTI